MITLPKLAAEALGTFLAADMKDRFGRSHARLAEIIPLAAQLTLECIGNTTRSSTTLSILCSSPWPATTSSKGGRC